MNEKKPGLLRSIASAIARTGAAYWASHNTEGKTWLALGVLGLTVDAALCYQYGVTQTTWHGLGFAMVAFFFARLPDGAYTQWERGNKLASVILWGCVVAFGAVAYQSHIGYGAGVRMGDIKQASLQDARYESIRSTEAENAGDVAMWKRQIEELKWAPQVKSTAIRDQIAEKQAAADREAKRGGCGTKCEAIKREVVQLQKELGAVEQREDLTGRIAATQRLVDKARETAAVTDAGMSSVAMQTTANTQLFGLIRAYWTGEKLEQALKTTDDSAKLANLLITAAGSLAFMLMAPVGFFMAGRNRIPMIEDEPAAEPRHSPAGGIFQASNDYAPPARSAGLSPAELQDRIRYALKVKHGTIGDLITAQQATA